MKNKFTIIVSLAILVILGVGCEPSEILYSDEEYAMFEDSVLACPVMDNDTIYSIYISSTVASDHDRNYAVQILEKKSNAIEGYHYKLVSPNVTIKKGELAGCIQLKPNYKNFKSSDSLCVTLQLLAPKEQKLNLYKDEVNIQLVKCPPLDVNLFTTNAKFYATFPYSESEFTVSYIKTEKVNDHRLLLKKPFDTMHDLYIDFDYSDVLNPVVKVPEQIAFLFGSYGEISVRSSVISPSWFYPDKEDRKILMYLEFFIPTVGSFGTHRYIVEWVDESEIEDNNNQIN